MSGYNVLEFAVTCPICSTTGQAVAEFKLGELGGHLYHVGDTLRWVGTNPSVPPQRPEDGNSIVEGYVDCPYCRYDYWVIIVVKNDIVTDVSVDPERKGYVSGPWIEQVKTIEQERFIDQLIRQITSGDTHRVSEVLHELREQRWLMDGSLRGAKLRDADLSSASLTYADLQGADLYRGSLNNANLASANLKWANLMGAELREANLSRSNLLGASLDEIDAQQANFNEAVAPSAHFRNADLRDTLLHSADLRECSFVSASLQQSHLGQADLSGANLSDARLEQCFLLHTNLQDVNFAGADLSQSHLMGANLTGALHLPNSMLRQVKTLEKATMPDGSRYDGRFALATDIANATQRGIAIDDPESLAEFYGVSVEVYQKGQLASTSNDG